MSLSKDALDTITANAIVAAGINIATSTPAALVPDNFKLQSLEHLQDGRSRFRAAMSTQSIADFSAYVQRQVGEGPGAAGFVDQDAMSARVIFNLGTPDNPGHGDDTATLDLKPTAAYSALNSIIGKPLSQQALAEWLEDWAPHLEAQEGDKSLVLSTAINGIRRMSIKAVSQRDSSVGDFSAARSSMDEIEAKSLETLPTGFIFTAIPFEGLQSAAITLRLSVITGADVPVLKLRWVGEEAQREEFARQFKAALEAEVGGFVPLTLGALTLNK
ncbi:MULTISPECIES: DUF2303 family protein [unclassified Pseudomonas]|uniref:DUF2303 family protein n=1 Tax=unclassified Pseudomonas TaxID=196821 RepID=UPI00244AD777|nr:MULTISPECIES: DUF2303 family protein [unclassified Pseudomonas]MDG9928503.1 YfdQ family protein [Pseudomonas sp. GD04042]MDH0482673.1 YfdQ family protein [Pseudomonas sp. GD04015]MDH0604625.1 YfdQ family protein [Pseudomonas sp. GD03869]